MSYRVRCYSILHLLLPSFIEAAHLLEPHLACVVTGSNKHATIGN
jgi:hypothetical protein